MPSLSPRTGAVKEPVCSHAAEHSKQAASCNHGVTAMSESEREDRALMKKLALGDSSALDKLYRKHCRTLEVFVRGKLYGVLSDTEASDILQNTFRRVQEKAHLYKPSGKVLSWIRKIAQNIIYDIIRQGASRRRRDTNYALARPPRGGEVEAAETPTWEYGDFVGAAGGLSGKDMPTYGDREELYAVTVPCQFVIIPRDGGGDNLVWRGDLPTRRAKWGRRDRVRDWMRGRGPDDILGMFRYFGLVHEDEQ